MFLKPQEKLEILYNMYMELIQLLRKSGVLTEILLLAFPTLECKNF
uniref:Uncharacterized protein n=1 Tax=Podoviridae sp. ct8Lf7 TaxID=2827723 RepID=A0A8S5S0K0_9CAUD|nr:MAG TPA: hypothetical protein [Podoviridae sp. ct8Lf7]